MTLTEALISAESALEQAKTDILQPGSPLAGLAVGVRRIGPGPDDWSTTVEAQFQREAT